MITFIVINLFLKLILSLNDNRIRLFDDSGVYILATDSWHNLSSLPYQRDRANFFTVIWALIIRYDNAPLLIIVVNTLITLIAGTISILLLNKVIDARLINFVFVTLIIQSPLFLYYEKAYLAESLSLNIILVTSSLFLFIFAKLVKQQPVTFEVLIISFLIGISISLVKTSFIVILLAFFGSFMLIILLSLFRLKFLLRYFHIFYIPIFITICIILGSSLVGLSTGSSLTQNIKSISNMSGFNAVFKFAPTLNCNSDFQRDYQSLVNDLCSLKDPKVTDSNFDQIMWREPFLSHWGRSSASDFDRHAQIYRGLSRQLILDNPKAAGKLIFKDLTHMFNPRNSPRFTTSTYPKELWSNLNPNIKFPKFSNSPNKDILFVATKVQNSMRFLLIFIALIVLFFTRNLLSFFLISSWIIYVLLISITSYPSQRYLAIVDILLFFSIYAASSSSKIHSKQFL